MTTAENGTGNHAGGTQDGTSHDGSHDGRPDGETDHDATVRRSFAGQVGLFTEEDSLFARRETPSTSPSPAPSSWFGPLGSDMIVLDVACGAGHIAEEIAPHVRQVVGVDLTPTLLRLAAGRLRVAGVDNVLLQEGTGSRLPFLDGSFDLVVCRSALHHFADPAGPVAEMARVCRPGGRVAVADMVAPGPEIRAALDEIHRRIDPSHTSVLLDTELAELLSSAVGPLTGAATAQRHALPVDQILTDVADRATVLAALKAELAGGPATGLDPVVADGELRIVVAMATAQATRVAA